MKIARILTLLLISLVIAPLAVVATAFPQSASAITGADFHAGNIISDSLFYDGNAMTGDGVQAFLAAEIPHCVGPTPCMTTARQDTPTMAAQTGLCDTYPGASNERVSDIIAKVGLACGVSQKVLLVLIQKEEGLVTATSPTQWAYDHATGFSCPDTAPCNPAFAGFFYQVYYAAHQFKLYQLHPSSYNFQADRVQSIRLSTNAACGSTAVFIQNQATAGLYDYTPYQPNAAALANLNGNGDGCSTYGNRNFWVFYTDWFGSTLVNAGTDAIAAAYATTGGATGTLGAALAPSTCTDLATSCSEAFAQGAIYWSLSLGAWPVYGSIQTYYDSTGGLNGTLGAPAAHDICGIAGGGCSQQFAAGTVYASPTGTTFAVYGVIQSKYAQDGGASGELGWPTAENICGLSDGGCTQTFQTGEIYYSPASGARSVAGAIQTLYASSGGRTGSLGYPPADEQQIAENGGGTSQAFAFGTIYSSATAGTFAVYGEIQAEFARRGGPAGSLGWPTAENTCGLTGGGCSQPFQNGSIYYSSAFGGKTVAAPVLAFYLAAGAQTGVLGYPSAEAVTVSQNGGGVSQAFQGGGVYSSSAGVFDVVGALATTYAQRGGPAGSLGWPTAAQTCTTNGCSQTFQNGTLSENAIAYLYAQVSGSLGAPLANPVSVAGGTSQAFAFGTIYSSATAGTFAVYGEIQAEFARRGGPAGSLGWPTAENTCGLTGGGCSQPFQNGSIYYSSAFGGKTVAAPVLAFYLAAGAQTGVLGYPSAEAVTVSQNGGGVSQAFQGGGVYSSSAGVFDVVGALATTYAQRGGPAGSLGWPTAAQTCTTNGVCTQTAQGGSISVSAIDKAFDDANGTLGAAVGSEFSISANGGGSAQAYVYGTIYSGSAGAFPVYGAIQTEYQRDGGPGGSLGWPLADNVCGLSGGGCSQQFQNGSIYYSPSIGEKEMSSAVATLYETTGGLGGSLGAPLANPVSVAGGTSQAFAFGTIYSSATAGTFAVYGEIQAEFARRGGPAGSLGWPTAENTCGLTGGGCSQPFQNGSIYYSSAFGGKTVAAPVLAFYLAAGAQTGVLGYPSAEAVTVSQNGGGVSQAFQGGGVYSSSAGVFDVVGALATTYAQRGGPAGSLGWPTAAQTCTTNGCSQTFQNGTLP